MWNRGSTPTFSTINKYERGDITKKCSKCGLSKDESEFYTDSRRKDGLRSACKECVKVASKKWSDAHKYPRNEQQKNYQKIWRKNRKQLLDDLKTPCVKCGETRKYVIDFHHIDPSNKSFSIMDTMCRSEVAVKAEIEKCVCLCRNCHQEFHHFYGLRPKHSVEALEEYLNN